MIESAMADRNPAMLRRLKAAGELEEVLAMRFALMEEVFDVQLNRNLDEFAHSSAGDWDRVATLATANRVALNEAIEAATEFSSD